MPIYGFRTHSILRALSEDSRISITELAKILKCSRITAARLLDNVTKQFDIKFGIELDEDRLGMTQRHLLLIKLEKKPRLDELRKMFATDPYVNCAFMCDGGFDLMIHSIANSPMDYTVWESLLPGKLADYGVDIYPSQLMLTNFGYWPVNPQTLLAMADNVDVKDKELLALLSENSRLGISEIASRLKIGRTTVNYRMHVLHKSEFIKRFTISLNKPLSEYILAYATNYHFNKTSHLRSIKMMEYYKGYDEKLPLMNTFQLLAPMSGSYRFLGISLFDSYASAMKDAIKAHKEIFNQENVKIKHARILDIVKGSYPFRNVDIYSNYRRFKWSTSALGNTLQNDKN